MVTLYGPMTSVQGVQSFQGYQPYVLGIQVWVFGLDGSHSSIICGTITSTV